MPNELLIVMLCELGERILAMRELLGAPAVAAKPHTRAVAALLDRGLDGVEERLQRAVPAYTAAEQSIAGAAALADLGACGRALRRLHLQLGLLDIRWSAAPVDIFLRKLRDDTGDMPHPIVVLSSDYDALDDVAERIRVGLRQEGVSPGDARPGDAPVIALPCLEAGNPLAWPLVLPTLARLNANDGDGATLSDRHGIAAVEMGGPAVFAALAVRALMVTPDDRPVWPLLASLSAAAHARAGGLDPEDPAGGGFEQSGPVGLFTTLARTRDRLLGFDAMRGDATTAAGFAGAPMPAPEVAVALLEKLAAGTPINAVDPPLPPEFTARLDAVRDSTGFYELIDPLGEQPASLAAILGVGWLYKVRYSYPLFLGALEAAREQPGAALGAALATYRPHMIARNELLLQSIEAAHVQGIFLRERLDD